MITAAISAGLGPGQAAFAFAGSALLFPYYFGLLYSLTSTGYIVPGETPLAGISGGALTSAVGCAGYPAHNASSFLTNAILQRPQHTWAIRESLLLELARKVPAAAFKQCSGKVHVALSLLNDSSGFLGGTTSHVVHRFTSNEDYFRAVVASTTIACAGHSDGDPAAAGAAFYQYRGKATLDGGYANNLTTLCHALGLQYGGVDTACVSVYAYEPGIFRKYGPGEEEADDLATSATAAAVAFTGGPVAADPVRDVGPRALSANCSALSASGRLPSFMPGFELSGSWPSIYPGCDPRNPIAFTKREWQEMALDGVKAAPYLHLMYEYGVRDAQLWAQNQTESMRSRSGSNERACGGSGGVDPSALSSCPLS